MLELITKHAYEFAYGMDDQGRHSTQKIRLDLIDEEPVFCPKHRLSKAEWEFIDVKVADLRKCGLVEKATEDYAAVTVLKAKKDADGNYIDKRMCGDY